MTHSSITGRRAGGYTLIEVLVGILIFAVGMMALAQLQGSLAQNSGDANARTVAINIAEETIETARAFSQITSDGVNAAYEDIVDETTTVTRSGYAYTVETDVTDYYYTANGKTFTTTAPDGVVSSDFKKVALTVTWEGADGREFRVDDDTSSNLGSGSITVTDVISSITSPSTGKVILGNGGSSQMYAPPVDYTPGQNPDIVSINLGDNKFKESTTPLPDVIRTDELVETRFDVITYSNPVNSNATFLRREEFLAVSCECMLQVPSDGAGGGLRPTIWNGEYYTEGEFVAKPYGVSANNQQSAFCDICCRDHHDGGLGEDDVGTDPGRSLYSPFRLGDDYFDSGALAGDHKHYHRDNKGDLELADEPGDLYVEACRLVRKDGFFRVAQDLRQEGLNAFPGNFLDEEAEVSVYSKYVTDAVSDFERQLGSEMAAYPFPLPTMETPADQGLVFPATSFANATVMSEASGVTKQQLRSRGLYIDFMSSDLRAKINCLDDGGTGEDCEVPQVSSALEIIPFYDVQLTWLSRWTETPSNNPIDVTNEAIANDNSHSRGLASLEAGFGYSAINSAMHGGNLGLTGTDPIDLRFASEVEDFNLYAKAVDPNAPPELSGIRVIGEITSAVGGVKAADVEIEPIGAECDRTLTGFECTILEGFGEPTLKVFNYFKQGKELYACSPELDSKVKERVVSKDIRNGSYAIFVLPTVISTNVSIVIREGGC